jgi:transposase
LGQLCHDPASCQCDACGNALVLIGEDISELDVEPARFFVHLHIRPNTPAAPANA